MTTNTSSHNRRQQIHAKGLELSRVLTELEARRQATGTVNAIFSDSTVARRIETTKVVALCATTVTREENLAKSEDYLFHSQVMANLITEELESSFPFEDKFSSICDTESIEAAMPLNKASWNGLLEVYASLPDELEDALLLLDRQDITKEDIEEAKRYAYSELEAPYLIVTTCLRERLRKALIYRSEEERNILYSNISAQDFEDLEEATYELESPLLSGEIDLSDALSELLALEGEISLIEERVAELLA